MKAPALKLDGNAAIIAVAAAVGLYLVFKALKGAAQAVGQGANVVSSSLWNSPGLASDPANINAGTAYAGTGVIGSVGHAADAASGGTLSSIGEWIGGGIYDLTHPNYDPNAIAADPNRPPVAPGVVSNPVMASPIILQRTYKENALDVQNALGTNELFTPSAVSGSSGAWADDGNAIHNGLATFDSSRVLLN